jgi:hypothetical protein
MYQPLISAFLSTALQLRSCHALPDPTAPMAGSTFNSFDHIR